MSTVELAVISVAGIGSRLGLNTPKGLINLGGKTLIERQLELVDEIPEVRVVIGYREEEVVSHVSKIRPDAIFVRNRDYDRTSLLQSMFLAIRHWKGKFLALEGDVLFERTAFGRFLQLSHNSDPGLLGITRSSTDDALYVRTRLEDDGKMTVTGFQRRSPTSYEWSGLALLDAKWIENRYAYPHEILLNRLPLPAMIVPAFEVDTSADLERAHHAVRSNDWEPQLTQLEGSF